jgi:hypothetical protein
MVVIREAARIEPVRRPAGTRVDVNVTDWQVL